MILKIPPKMNKYFESFLSNIGSIDYNIFEQGPVQFYFPQAFRENISFLKKDLNLFSFPIEIFFAHKANKSSVFVKEANSSNINIDVASLNELNNVLAFGFDEKRIECTGIKNEAFIQKALDNNCLLVVDSISELDLIKQLKRSDNKPRILIRINNPFPSHGTYSRISRFGILKEEFQSLNKDFFLGFEIEGLHIHFDEYTPEYKSSMIKETLELYQKLYENKIFPKIINIGGGYKAPVVNSDVKTKVIEEVESISFEENAYAKTILGIEKGRNGKISKTSLQNKIYNLDAIEFIGKVFDNNEIKNLIEELSLSLFIEPGYFLLDNCGVIIMRVLGTKKIGHDKFGVIVDGNMYNLSSQMKKWITDPILISRKNESSQKFEGFVLGNLCKEDDLLLDRKIIFEKTPQLGDLLVFCNTAGYSGGFEDTNAILQPKLKNYVYLEENEESKIFSEEEYLGIEK